MRPFSFQGANGQLAIGRGHTREVMQEPRHLLVQRGGGALPLMGKCSRPGPLKHGLQLAPVHS